MSNLHPAYFRHRFADVTSYLHHRPPYLLVDQIEEISDQKIVTTTTVPKEAFFIQGHFPGAPILPGAMMQEMTTQSAGVLIAANYNPMQQFNTEDPDFNEYALGVLIKVSSARYRGFARPGDQLQTTVTLIENIGSLFDFEGRISLDDKTICQNSFQLTNLPSSTLSGRAQPASSS